MRERRTGPLQRPGFLRRRGTDPALATPTRSTAGLRGGICLEALKIGERFSSREATRWLLTRISEPAAVPQKPRAGAVEAARSLEEMGSRRT